MLYKRQHQNPPPDIITLRMMLLMKGLKKEKNEGEKKKHEARDCWV